MVKCSRCCPSQLRLSEAIVSYTSNGPSRERVEIMWGWGQRTMKPCVTLETPLWNDRRGGGAKEEWHGVIITHRTALVIPCCCTWHCHIIAFMQMDYSCCFHILFTMMYTWFGCRPFTCFTLPSFSWFWVVLIIVQNAITFILFFLFFNVLCNPCWFMISLIYYHVCFPFPSSTILSLGLTTGDDCKGKRHSETHTLLLTQSSRPRRLAGALWSLLAYTG